MKAGTFFYFCGISLWCTLVIGMEDSSRGEIGAGNSDAAIMLRKSGALRSRLEDLKEEYLIQNIHVKRLKAEVIFDKKVNDILSLFFGCLSSASSQQNARIHLKTLLGELQKSQLDIGTYAFLEPVQKLERHSLIYYLLKQRFHNKGSIVAGQTIRVIMKNVRLGFSLAAFFIVFLSLSGHGGMVDAFLLGLMASGLAYIAALAGEQYGIPELLPTQQDVTLVDAMLEDVMRAMRKTSSKTDEETASYIRSLHSSEMGAVQIVAKLFQDFEMGTDNISQTMN